MKRTSRSFFGVVSLVILLLPSIPVGAASQTEILKPTSATLGLTKIYLDGSQTPSSTVGGGGTDLNNALVEDGQFALLDPELAGPGTQLPNPDSVLFLDYDKDTICSGATIQAVNVHAIWKGSAESTQQNDVALLLKAEDISSTPSFGVDVNTTNGQFDITNQIFGGLVTASGLAGGTFSGNVSTTLTHDSSPVQTLPTASDLKDPNARLVIGMGDGYIPDGETDPVYNSGTLDYAYLEVTYDDSGCTPGGVDTAAISSPKTGSILTVSIIAAALLASIGASLFGIKRTKLKHRASERE